MTESVDLAYEILGRNVKDELDWEVLKDIEFVLLAVAMHVDVKLILGCEETVAFQVVHHLLCTMETELLEVDEAGDGSPFKAV